MQAYSQHAPISGYKSVKASQIAAFFADSEVGITKAKVIKLVYLSEREFMKRYAHPMTFDEFYSIKHGPICSATLNGIDGNLGYPEWGILRLGDENEVSTTRGVSRADLNYVNDAEFEVLTDIWKKFGGYTSGQLRTYTHKHCSEYTETNSRIPISYGDIFKALGFENPYELEGELADFRRSQSILAS